MMMTTTMTMMMTNDDDDDDDDDDDEDDDDDGGGDGGDYDYLTHIVSDIDIQRTKRGCVILLQNWPQTNRKTRHDDVMMVIFI